MIISDKISERYRKYIIGIKYKGNLRYILWSSSKEGEDYFAVNERKKIIYSVSINDLKFFLNKNISNQVDPDLLFLWLKNHKSQNSYNIYDLDHILFILNNQNFNLSNCTTDELNELLDFRNLFSDYVYQIDSKKYLKILKSRNQAQFFNYANAHCLWLNDHKNTRLKDTFNHENFTNEFIKCIDFFVSCFILGEI
ncbi:MAG: hypothetical protein IPL23_00245 [Saprospiraceae bacterium]|nr:hypothetical protein [Saprospiraceae bacterium]